MDLSRYLKLLITKSTERKYITVLMAQSLIESIEVTIVSLISMSSKMKLTIRKKELSLGQTTKSGSPSLN